MVAAQTGDRIAYESLLRSCIPLIKRVARRQGVWPDCIDDVVQETLLAIHRARQTYDPRRSFTAWLWTIAQRRAIDGLRRGRRFSAYEVHAPLAYENYPDSGSDSESTAFAFDRTALLGAVQALPVRQREAVNVLAFQSHSLPHAATAMGRTAGSLRVSWHRAITTLRNQNQTEMTAVKHLAAAEQGRQCSR
jgi:RNA polymerase sigma-70 factor (ECF subfamily)